jgi:hypothetical protein
LTLAMFEALIERHEQRIKRERLNIGIVAAMIYNTAPFADSKREPLHPMDFVDGSKSHRQGNIAEMSPEEQATYFNHLLGAEKE